MATFLTILLGAVCYEGAVRTVKNDDQYRPPPHGILERERMCPDSERYGRMLDPGDMKSEKRFNDLRRDKTAERVERRSY